MEILDRFLNYVKIDTASNSKSEETPSTSNQRILAKLLIKELNELNIKDIYFDEEHCYLYALLKGNEEIPKIGFVGHLDTSEDAKSSDIMPNIIDNYDGNDIILKNGNIINTIDYPDLNNHIGKTIITSDGTTLLGADDKSGIAEIMGMLEYYSNTNEEHGDIYVCFTPDEEIGLGTKYFDFSKFKADVAYTVDGSDLGEISYENFNAATAKITIEGISTHTGSGKDKMINSCLLATIFNNKLPNEIPYNTGEYEGFYHLEEIEGNVSNTKMTYLIRDFNKDKFESRKNKFYEIASKLMEEYNTNIILDIKDTYYNMYNKVSNKIESVNNVKKAMIDLNIKPITTPIRGGTDGAELTEKGLICPNIGTGGHNFHSVLEYVTKEDMEKVTQILIGIAKEYTKKNKYYDKAEENEKGLH